MNKWVPTTTRSGEGESVLRKISDFTLARLCLVYCKLISKSGTFLASDLVVKLYIPL